MDHGHPEARFYPLGRLLDESNIVVERVNAQEVTRATLLQLAISGVLFKKSAAAFEKQIGRLSFETVPYEPDDGDGG